MIEPVIEAFSFALWFGHRWGELYVYIYFPDKAASPSKVEWNVVAHLAVELERFMHFPPESRQCHFPSQPGLHGPPAPPESEGVDNSIQMCLAPSRRWQVFLNSFRGQAIFTFHERTNYLSGGPVDRGLEKRGGWWLIIFIKGIWKLAPWKVLS